eukprot:CAMPEP_0206545756 /NCGR_PEP_ID=MMETSP0325_2-20121206/12319_1 /ASSEMBLY_ACC=CAM_ASM_000347 /TAXON_ID=2866 /ORGANISM="Crypthecodinium cohnii, Strain Seligo" /LENGTH=62 /DNA_ID=CAMNT_0054044789 /DNA_START=98 /DNA_END=286 /DNA_ORIENTATION=-
MVDQWEPAHDVACLVDYLILDAERVKGKAYLAQKSPFVEGTAIMFELPRPLVEPKSIDTASL